jgi:MFS family permease
VALFGGLLRIGRFGGPLIGGAVAAASGLRLPFAVMTVFTLMALLVVWGSLPADESDEALPALTLGRYTRQLVITLQSEWRPLLSAGSGFLLLQIVRAGPDAIIPLYGADVLGLNVAQIGWVMGISGALDMALFYPTGMIMDRFGRKRAVVPSFLTMAAGLGLVPLSSGFTGLVLAAGLLGIGNGLGSGTMMTLGADLSPSGRHGEFLGLWHLIGDTGSTVGPLLIGAVAGGLALSAAALVLSGLGFGGGLLFLRTVPETLRRPDS